MTVRFTCRTDLPAAPEQAFELSGPRLRTAPVPGNGRGRCQVLGASAVRRAEAGNDDDEVAGQRYELVGTGTQGRRNTSRAQATSIRT